VKIASAEVVVTSPGRNFVSLRLETEDGVVGWGDATLNGRELAVVSYLRDHVNPILIGRDAAAIEDTWQYLYRGAYWRRGPVTMAAFSPDGSYLALQLNAAPGGADGGSATQLEVVATATGQLTTVPDTSLSSDALIGFGWPPGGDRLVAELSFTTKVQLASWLPGAARLAVTVVRPGSGVDSIFTG